MAMAMGMPFLFGGGEGPGHLPAGALALGGCVAAAASPPGVGYHIARFLQLRGKRNHVVLQHPYLGVGLRKLLGGRRVPGGGAIAAAAARRGTRAHCKTMRYFIVQGVLHGHLRASYAAWLSSCPCV